MSKERDSNNNIETTLPNNLTFASMTEPAPFFDDVVIGFSIPPDETMEAEEDVQVMKNAAQKTGDGKEETLKSVTSSWTSLTPSGRLWNTTFLST